MTKKLKRAFKKLKDAERQGEELERAKAFSAAIAEHALELGGTCGGEHGVGYGKLRFLESTGRFENRGSVSRGCTRRGGLAGGAGGGRSRGLARGMAAGFRPRPPVRGQGPPELAS